MRRSSALLLMVLVLPVSAEENLFFTELPVVASVSRLPQRLADAPASVSVIDRDMIRASGARSLNDLFRLVPGFQTFAHSDVAARVNYHGITDDNDFSPRMQVLVDGRSLHSPLFRGGVNWALIPVALEDIERIEVVRGSNSVSFGNNAFMGVVNIVTMDPSLVRGVSLSTSNGSQNVRDHTLRGGGKLGDDGDFRLAYQETSDDGLEGRYDWEDSYLNRRIEGRLGYALSVRDSLEISFGKVEGRFLSGSLNRVTRLSNPCNDPLRDREESSTWLQGRWLRSLSGSADFSLRYSLSEDRGDNTYVIDPVSCKLVVPYPVDNTSGDWGRRHEIEAIHNFVPARDTRLVWGLSWRYDSMESETMMRGRGKESRQVWRAFANGEWKPSARVTANLGASSEYDTLAGNHLSPRASVAFHLTPENTVRIGYTQAWRTASILAYRANHLAPDGSAELAGNPNLPAERLDSWELAYLGNWRDWRMSLDVRHFQERISDRLMAVRPAAGLADSEQSIQDIRISGYELQWKWQPFDSTRLLLNHASLKAHSSLSGNGWLIAATPGSHFEGITLGPTGALEPEYEVYQRLAEYSAPRKSSSAMWMQRLPWGFDFSLMRYWVDTIKWTRNTQSESYQRTDARLAYTFKLGGKRGEVAYTAQSLDGSHAEQRQHSSRRPNGRFVDRRHWLSLRLDF